MNLETISLLRFEWILIAIIFILLVMKLMDADKNTKSMLTVAMKNPKGEIVVTNTPDVLTECTADLVLALARVLGPGAPPRRDPCTRPSASSPAVMSHLQ